jgi:hypothetical protein
LIPPLPARAGPLIGHFNITRRESSCQSRNGSGDGVFQRWDHFDFLSDGEVAAWKGPCGEPAKAEPATARRPVTGWLMMP